jgi:ribonuclease Z
MFDCGEGTVRQLLNSSVRASKIDSVFITHLHGDHVSHSKHCCLLSNAFVLLYQFYGLPGLGMRMIGLREEQEPTRVFAPFGIRSFMGTSVSA